MTRRLECMHLAALGIDAGHYMFDRAVFAGCVHGLKHREHRPLILRVKLLLQCGKALDSVHQHGLGLGFFDVEAASVGGVEIGEPELAWLVDAEAAESLCQRHDGSSRLRR